MSYKKFIEKSVRLRPDYEDNLLVVNLPWKEKFDILIGDIPDFFTDIYSNCNGTDPEEDRGINYHFIPGYRLMTIDEVLKSHPKIIEEYAIGEALVIPFLVSDSGDFICYHSDNNVNRIVCANSGDIAFMYDSIDSFWATLCDCYDNKAFAIDFKSQLSVDEKIAVPIEKKHNPKSDFFV